MWDQEVYGKTAVFHEAAKLEWLRGRPDMQTDEHQKFLDKLERSHPEHDALFPWLARERKKGRVNHANADAYLGDLHYMAHDGKMRHLESEDLDGIQEWMKYHKQTGNKGIDIMQHHIGDAIHEADKHDGGGEIVHTFGNKMGENAWRDWTIRRLRHKRDMRKEGQRMSHCVGSNGMPYIDRQADGHAEYYSLRDPQNNPHATLELHKDMYGGGSDHNPHEPEVRMGFKQGEYYGPHDQEVDYDHNELFNKWANPMGHYLESGHGEEEEEFEPWWDEEYQINGPESLQEFNSWTNDSYEEAYAPQEYDNAVADAAHHGLNPPSLYVGEPDFDRIWEDFLDTHREKPDPEKIKKFRDDFNYHTPSHENFDARATEWLEEEYNNYLDPYGQKGGPGFGFSSPGTITPQYIPSANPEGIEFNTTAPQLPGSHYPGRKYAGEEYLARNFMHHLQEGRYDPQTGETTENLRDRYPAWRPQNEEGARPPGLDVGPSIFQQRDEAMANDPARPYERDRSGDQGNLWLHDPHAFGMENRPPDMVYPQGEWNRPDVVSPRDKPKRAEDAETFYGDPNTMMHQPPIPGMQNTFDPTNQTFYPVNQQQGMIFPGGWYHDSDAYSARKTDLPPHLFMPEHFTWMPHTPHPEQQSMWNNYQSTSPTGEILQYSTPNTQVPGVPPSSQVPGALDREQVQAEQQWRDQRTNIPRMPWVAKAERPWEKPRWSIESVDKTYHPRQEDEWVDEDEPDFTVIQPEPRWGV